MTFLNRVRVATSTIGTGTLALGAAAVGNVLSFAAAGATDGMTVTYCLEEGVDFEIGRGVIGDGVATLTRATVLKSSISGSVGTAKMELAGSAEVRCIQSAEDINDLVTLAGSMARLPETIKTAGWTVATSEAGRMLVYNSASAGTAALPAVAANAGEVYHFRNINTGLLTLDPNSSEQIEGAATLAVARGRAVVVWANEGKTAWRAMILPAAATVLRPSGTLWCDYGGSANAITLAHGGAGVMQTGLTVRFKASGANTGATTINLDGLGAIACRTVTGVALPAGYIRTDIWTEAFYDGTYWVVDRQPERGSTATGDFVRYADGTLEMTSGTLIFDAPSTAAGGIFASSVMTWTLPAPCVSPPAVAAGKSNSSTRWVAVTVASTSASFRMYSYLSSDVATGGDAQAKGKWY